MGGILPMQGKDDSVRNVRVNPSPAANAKRIGIEAAILAAAALAASLLLARFVFAHLSAGLSALIALALYLFLAWLGYLLVRRWHTAVVRAWRAQQIANDEELCMLRTVIDSLPVPIYVKDTQNHFLMANRQLRTNLTGSPDGNVIGLDDSSFFHRDIAKRFFNEEQAIIRTGELTVGKPDCLEDLEGRKRWSLTTKVPFRDKDGSVVGIIGIGRDITAERQQEAELRLMGKVIDSLPDGIWVKDTQGRYLLANRALRKYFTGSPDGDVFGRDDFSFFSEEQARGTRNDEQAIMQGGVPLVSRTERIRNAEGNDTWALTTKVPYRDEDGGIIGIIGIGPRHLGPKADRSGDGQGAHPGRGCQPGQKRVPGQYEPRNPHTAQWRHRHDRAGARHRTDSRTARVS